jgi:hypothetical protein
VRGEGNVPGTTSRASMASLYSMKPKPFMSLISTISPVPWVAKWASTSALVATGGESGDSPCLRTRGDACGIRSGRPRRGKKLTSPRQVAQVEARARHLGHGGQLGRYCCLSIARVLPDTRCVRRWRRIGGLGPREKVNCGTPPTLVDWKGLSSAVRCPLSAGAGASWKLELGRLWGMDGMEIDKVDGGSRFGEARASRKPEPKIGGSIRVLLLGVGSWPLGAT